MSMDFTEHQRMPILQYHECEALKRAPSSQLATDWAHYHRFLADCLLLSQPQEYFENIHPTFAEYRQWKADYPGWSQGPILRNSAHWKGGPKRRHPMNRFLQDVRKNVRQILR